MFKLLTYDLVFTYECNRLRVEDLNTFNSSHARTSSVSGGSLPGATRLTRELARARWRSQCVGPFTPVSLTHEVDPTKGKPADGAPPSDIEMVR